jgi:hypothetical protein
VRRCATTQIGWSQIRRDGIEIKDVMNRAWTRSRRRLMLLTESLLPAADLIPIAPALGARIRLPAKASSRPAIRSNQNRFQFGVGTLWARRQAPFGNTQANRHVADVTSRFSVVKSQLTST